MSPSEKPVVTGTDFYRKKGYVKALTLHLTAKLYENLRKRAYEERTSLQVAARAALEKGLKK